MNPALKRTIARLVTATRPTLLYYHVPKAARRGIAVRQRGDIIDIHRTATAQLIRINTGNSIHLPDMVESFDLYTASIEPVAFRYRGGIVQLTDFSSPRLHRVTGFEDFAVLCPSTTEPFTTTRQYLDFAALSPGDAVIDCGAYCGLTSIAFSKAVGASGKVIAVEPDPINFDAAACNIARHAVVNGLNNIVLSPAAVADRDETLVMSSEGTMGSALASIVGTYRGQMVDVPARTLASLADENGLRRVAFVKIDIEGAERIAVPAARSFLAQHRPRLIIEGHRVDGVSTIPPLVDLLEADGYDCRVEAQEGMTFQLILAAPRTGAINPA